jgi:hypothetical protein
MGWKRWIVLALAWGAGGLACGGKPAWPSARNPGDCLDPCQAMVCPAGSHCAWDAQCRPRCDADGPPRSWKP